MTSPGRVTGASVRDARAALWLPIFDGLADPRTVARIAAEAEAAGWDGVFVWDHLRWREPVVEVADPWITMAAIATATERLRFGPMVSPLARRRPAKVARETVTLDRLSGGRLTLGVGVGSDRFAGELSRTGEQVDDKVRAQMLDELLVILEEAWSGDVVDHRGRHYTVDGVQFLPRPVQHPRIPVWVATLYGNTRPLRRAARHDGFFPVNLDHPDQLAELVATVTDLRRDHGDDLARPYDIAMAVPPDTDPDPYIAAGATWILVEFDPGTVSVDHVRGVLGDGPPESRARSRQTTDTSVGRRSE
ncbi:MAG TPA: LLM class flavin-dependent oxidoreductase [Acidimicrobiales bacterium]|nr:LLM class flavin-dependent oxidoreductase [Acidimicrobiales bacterium]